MASRTLTTLMTLFIVAVLVLLPALLSPYQQDLTVRIMIYAIFALSLELLVGKTGLVSMGHAAFFGIGAYVTVLASPEYEAGSLLTIMPLALLAAGAYAVVVGALCLRTQGVYFIMVTLAFAQMAYFIFHDTALAGGSDGIFLNVKPLLTIADHTLLDFADARVLYYVVVAALVSCFLLLALIQRSRFGHALAGIRSSEQRMRAVGYHTYWYKLAAFVLAAVMAALAGMLIAIKNGGVNPEMLSWHESGAVLMMIILGGLGKLRGAVVGAVTFILLKELFASEAIMGQLAVHWQLTLGLTMIVFVAFLPNGLIGLVNLAGRNNPATPASAKSAP